MPSDQSQSQKGAPCDSTGAALLTPQNCSNGGQASGRGWAGRKAATAQVSVGMELFSVLSLSCPGCHTAMLSLAETARGTGLSVQLPVTACDSTMTTQVPGHTPPGDANGPGTVTFMVPTRSSNDLKVAEFLRERERERTCRYKQQTRALLS